jgi:uncharacterized protein DUF6455
MSALLLGVASLFVFFGVVMALPYLHTGWRRVVSRNGELEIWPVMQRLGIPRDAAPRSDATMARAIRRCVMCPSLEECDHWLASGDTDGIDKFCPNAPVLEGLRKR